MVPFCGGGRGGRLAAAWKSAADRLGAGVGLATSPGSLHWLAGGRVSSRVFAIVQPHEAVDWLPHAVLLGAGRDDLAAYAPGTWQRWAIGSGRRAYHRFAASPPGRQRVTSPIAWSRSEKLPTLLCWPPRSASRGLLLASAPTRAAAASARLLIVVVGWRGHRDCAIRRARLRRTVRCRRSRRRR